MIKKRKINLKKINTSINTINIKNIFSIEKNIYKAIVIIGKRANKINNFFKKKLEEKLFLLNDKEEPLEEFYFENEKKINIVKKFEKLPKTTLIAIEEFLKGKIKYKKYKKIENKKLKKFFSDKKISKTLKTPFKEDNIFKKTFFKKDPFKKDTFKKDPFKKDPFKKDPFKKDPFKKDPFKKDSFKKDPFKKDPFKEDFLKKEKKEIKKENPFKEDFLKKEKKEIKKENPFKEDFLKKEKKK
ncbi:pentapeptide MXKDX repeat protein [Candidatus Shikimatogenerans silvanidophilus]|uniref:pentapeptide MXKDX repeat protein n=1 Tax=Candidatus Shikimatogenerans silvanidophilus TaxID=2782547 RepID=UPI001BAA38B1|nr:pentapeptide MXKDX repeat protein [Candidatus Shikimatogenerans silvanidophilus]